MGSIPSPRPLLVRGGQSMRGGGGGVVKAIVHTIFMSIILNMISFALSVYQFSNDWEWINGEFIHSNFSLVDKLITCLKLYLTAYDALHTKGSVAFGFMCWLVFFLPWFAIAYHHIRNNRTWTRTRIVLGMFIPEGGGILLYLGMLIPKNNAWHTNVVLMIIIVIVLVEGALLISAQIKDNGDNEHYRRDLLLKLVETAVSVIRFVDLKGRTHKPWDADKILHLVGSGLPMLIGVCLIGLMLYNMRNLFLYKLIEWRGKIARFFTVDEDGNAEEQAKEEAVGDVELAMLD